MKKRYKKIVPERRRCDCGARVINHHWLCDKCWGKKEQRRKHLEKRKNLPKNFVKKEIEEIRNLYK